MKQIEGLENMTCSQIMDTMNEIMEQAEARAASLSEEIQRSYEERDTVGAKAHEAAGGKDLKAYKDARLHYDMLTEWIAKAEAERDGLLFGPLIQASDSGTIKQRMNSECYDITGRAALMIRDLFRQMEVIHEEMKKQIRERNAVLMKLNECARPKDQDGNPAAPTVYRDTVIGPYLRELKNLQNNVTAMFKVFSDGFENPKKHESAHSYVPKQGEGYSQSWDGEKWVKKPVPPAALYTGLIED